MDKAKFEQYVSGRYEDQSRWIDGKAVKLKRKYTRMQGAVVILAALTTVAAAVGAAGDTAGAVGQWAAVGVSALVTIISGLLATFKYKEEWLNYRATAEALKREQYYYQARVGGYRNSPDPEALFVQRVEAILASENAEWLGIQRLAESASQPGLEPNRLQDAAGKQ